MSITSATFPRIFQAWSDAIGPETKEEKMAKHSLVWHGENQFGWKWDGNYRSETLVPITPLYDLTKVRALNPEIIILSQVKHYDALPSQLPDDDPWWLRDTSGNKIPGWLEGGTYKLNQLDPTLVAHVATLAKAIMDTGSFDGVFLDWMNPANNPGAIAMATAVREVIGDALLIINGGTATLPVALLNQANGVFMEGIKAKSASEWRAAKDTLSYNGANIRQDRKHNCFEVNRDMATDDLKRMRMATCLMLCYSNGHVLFSHPNSLPEPDHIHDWYPFWNNYLGKAITNMYSVGKKGKARDFEFGTAVYNPVDGTSVTVQGVKVPAGDGAMILS